MTTINEWREETDSIINELLEDGSNPESEYTIEHHFACHNFDRLEKLAVDLFKADFEVTDAEELELEDGSVIFCFDASKDGSLDADERKALHSKMMEGKCGGKTDDDKKADDKTSKNNYRLEAPIAAIGIRE